MGHGSSSVRAPRREERIAAVVDDFVARCAKDGRINPKFAKSDIPRLKKMLIDQVCEATGGPGTYAGRDMKETHAGMGVTSGEFDALVQDLVASLDQFDVSKGDQNELLGLLGPIRATSWRSTHRKLGCRSRTAISPRRHWAS